jgi:hypothetical protein
LHYRRIRETVFKISQDARGKRVGLWGASQNKGGCPVQTRELRRSSIAGCLCLVVVIAALAVAPAAFGQGSSVGTYGGEGGQAQGGVAQGQEGVSGDVGGSGPLPFTGLDLGLLIGGGLLLVGVGAGMARLVPKSNA